MVGVVRMVGEVGMVSKVGWQTAMGASTKKEKTHFSGRFSTISRKILFFLEVSLFGFVFFWFFTESWGIGGGKSKEGIHPWGRWGSLGVWGLLGL